MKIFALKLKLLLILIYLPINNWPTFLSIEFLQMIVRMSYAEMNFTNHVIQTDVIFLKLCEHRFIFKLYKS